MKLIADDAELELDPEKGGFIRSLRSAGRDIFHPAKDGLWPYETIGGCFALLPYSNRIRGGQFKWHGQRVILDATDFRTPHALHGLGWVRPWSVVEAGTSSVIIGLSVSDSAWPAAFEVRQLISLFGDRLEMKMTMINRGSIPAPAGMGWHPWFPKTPGTRLQFSADHVWLTSDPGLPEAKVVIPDQWCFDRPALVGERGLDHCFGGWKGRCGVSHDTYGCDIEAGPSLGHAVVYTPENAPCFCFEPVSHANDPFHSEVKSDGSGLTELAPGERLEASMVIRWAADYSTDGKGETPR